MPQERSGTWLVTTTHDRPRCCPILERLVQRQTIPYDWLVINDSADPSGYHWTMNQTVINRDGSKDTLPSICENWLAAIPYLTHAQAIIPIEDDDWIAPTFCETLLAQLEHADLAGISFDRYFDIKTNKYRVLTNNWHASLGASAFTPKVLPCLTRLAQTLNSVWLDYTMWEEFTGAKKLWPQLMHPIHVGIKGFPGAANLGTACKDDWTGVDPQWQILERWIGEDVQIYRELTI